MIYATELDTYSLQLEDTSSYVGYLDSVLLELAKHGKDWWLLLST